MNIALVYPPFYLESMYNLPPLGLINLATMLKDSPHQVVILDFVLAIRQNTLGMGRAIYDDCAQMILQRDPDVVGFSTQCTTYPTVIQIARKIKAQRPRVKIFVGGHNASFVDKRTLACCPWIDAVVRGEGEVTFQELIAAYAEGRDETDIAGVTFRQGREIIRNADRDLIGNLDVLPLADYAFVPPLAEYRDACEIPRSIAILEVGRGCPHQCVYCSESAMWRRRTRTFSVSRLVKEMRHLHRNFGAECFLLSFDQFTANRRFVEEFCRQVMAEQLNHLPWYCISRLDTVDETLLRKMREAGCESMCYGIDSGSKKTLAFIRKRIDEGLLYRRVRETTDQGILPTLSFVIGFPEEGSQDIDATLALALKTGIQGNSNPLVQMPTVLPGTDLYAWYGPRLVRQVDTYFSLGLEFDQGRRLVADEQLIESDPLLFSSFYNVPCRGLPLEDLKRIATYFPLIIKLYPKSFLLLSLVLEQSISALFLEWLQWVKTREQRDGLRLTAADCYQHFTPFADQIFRQVDSDGWRHLPEVVTYETLALEVGKYFEEKTPGTVEMDGLSNWRPKRKKNVLVHGFSRDLPAIIGDLKAGNFRQGYPVAPTWLVFYHAEDQLEVTEINDFGRDLIERCNGSASLKEIADALYGQYGQSMGSSAFLEACREAVDGLSELSLLCAVHS